MAVRFTDARSRRLSVGTLVGTLALLATPSASATAVSATRAPAPSALAAPLEYDGPGGIDGPGEVLCNAPARRMPVLRRGTSNHPYTKLLQAVLGGLRYRPGPVDGVYGVVTQRAVTRFQADHRLAVDGWVGAQTWRALKKAYCHTRSTRT